MIGQFQITAGLPSIELESETILEPNPSNRAVCRVRARKNGRISAERCAHHAELLDMAAFFIYQSEIETALRELTGGRTGEYRRFRRFARGQ